MLQSLVGDWLVRPAGLPLLACGMVGSAHGWRDAGYRPCPADPRRLIDHAVSVSMANGTRVLIVPGLMHTPANTAPDVMRGEETQIAGALALMPELAAAACIVLPGTHSKWARVRDGRVTGFATRMTGELFALLRQHSVLGRLMAEDQGTLHDAAFNAGLDAAQAVGGHDLGHQLFAVRTLGLTGRWPAEALGDYLSGLLIGHEVHAGLADDATEGDTESPLVLVGEAALCVRYARALQHAHRLNVSVLDNTAAAGLWDMAASAGLVRGTPETT